MSICYNNKLNWMLAHYISQWDCQRLWYFQHLPADGDSEVQSPRNPPWQDQLLCCNWYVGRGLYICWDGEGEVSVWWKWKWNDWIWYIAGNFQKLYFTLHQFYLFVFSFFSTSVLIVFSLLYVVTLACQKQIPCWRWLHYLNLIVPS